MEVVVLLFQGITALDALGPYEVLSKLPGTTVRFVAPVPGTQRTADGMLGLEAPLSTAEVTSADVLVVPGGPGTAAVMSDEDVLAWIRAVHATTRWTASVCTGSLILGAAGLLDGLEATTHWASMDDLADLGARPVRRRVVEQGRIITSAGVSAGIDMALRLAQLAAGDETAQAVQLLLEYDPQPPLDAGSPTRAPASVVARLRALIPPRSGRTAAPAAPAASDPEPH